MKRSILIRIGFGLVSLLGCVNNSGFQNGRNEKKHEVSLEEFIQRDYEKGAEIARKNNQHLIDNLRRTKVNIVCHKEKLERSIKKRLNELEHIYYGEIDNKPEPLSRINNSGLARIYLLLEDLQKKNFLADIGEALERDAEDKYTEYGGYIIFGRRDLELFPITSTLAYLPREKNNFFYKMPVWAFRYANIVHYHLHAVNNDDDSDSAGPSFNVNFHGVLGMGGDINYAIYRAKKEGKFHGAVITKLDGKRFNVDYFGCVKDRCGDLEVDVIDLGNYEY